MDVFSALFVMSLGSYIYDEDKLDIVGKLPIEIAIMILRKLDGASLLKACRVSKKWNSLCKTDKKLRQTIRQHKKEMQIKKQRFIYGEIGGRKSFVPKDESGAFKKRKFQQSINEHQPAVRRVSLGHHRSEIPLVVLERNGTASGASCQIVKRKCKDVKYRPKGIPESKKRRLLR